MTEIQYTDQQATEEALLLVIRKLRRLHPGAYADIMGRVPELAKQALHFADLRAERLRAYDKRDGITRTYRDVYAEIDAQTEAEDEV